MTSFVYIDMVADTEVDMEVEAAVAVGGKRSCSKFVTR